MTTKTIDKTKQILPFIIINKALIKNRLNFWVFLIDFNTKFTKN